MDPGLVMAGEGTKYWLDKLLMIMEMVVIDVPSPASPLASSFTGIGQRLDFCGIAIKQNRLFEVLRGTLLMIRKHGGK